MKRYSRVSVGVAKYGRGVFANELFLENEFIGDIVGEILDDPDHESDHCIDLGDDRSLEPYAPFRYLNHSCDANCEMIIFVNEDNPSEVLRVALKAVKPISEGDELTIDYGWSAEDTIPCECGSSECRGWIVHPLELTSLL